MGGSFHAPISAVRFESPAVSPNAIVIKDAEIGAMVKDHLAVNTTVVVTFDAAGKAIVRGSKTEGTTGLESPPLSIKLLPTSSCQHLPVPFRCHWAAGRRVCTAGGSFGLPLLRDSWLSDLSLR